MQVIDDRLRPSDFQRSSKEFERRDAMELRVDQAEPPELPERKALRLSLQLSSAIRERTKLEQTYREARIRLRAAREIVREAESDCERFAAWVDAIFVTVQLAIGGELDQIGRLREYGEAVFAIDATDPAGMVEFTISLAHSDGLRRCAAGFDWRAHEPLGVGAHLVDAYEGLGAVAIRKTA